MRRQLARFFSLLSLVTNPRSAQCFIPICLELGVSNLSSRLFLTYEEQQQEYLSRNRASANKFWQNDTIAETKPELKTVGSGVVFNVNKLKRNLVQQAMKEYKNELLKLLATPCASDVIEDKIAALVLSNPVATTTDSNLLEGVWHLTFSSDQASRILSESRFIRSPKRRSTSIIDNIQNINEDEKKIVSKPWNVNVGNMDNPFRTSTRLVHLEDLEEDEDPYILDTASFLNGFWSIHRHWIVSGLTRTTLELKQDRYMYFSCGKPLIRRKTAKSMNSLICIEILYLDNDLCISTDGNDESLFVHTKSETWSHQRKLNFLIATRSWLSTIQSPLRVRSRVFSLWSRYRNMRSGNQTANQTVLDRQNYDEEESKLTVLRMGNIGKSTKDDTAWDSEEDPFINLSADERQKVMKKMKLKEIEDAGKEQRMKSEKEKKMKRNEQKQFKKPFAKDSF